MHRMYDESSAPSDDLRTNAFTTHEITTFDGKICSEGQSPVCGVVYKPHSSYASRLDTNKERVHVEGLHFYPTMDGLINDRFGFNGWK